MRLLVAILLPFVLSLSQAAPPPAARFEQVQPDLFSAPGAQPNAWADYDNDGDLDLFVGFQQGKPNRLYRNDRGAFADVAADLGIADVTDTRAAAWGDFDADGDIDLYVGFTRRSETPNKLYRNEERGKRFTDVAKPLGVDAVGETRQPAWIDFDNDGDLDLFVAFRDAPNALFRHDGEKFVNVAKELGVDDPRRTVGAVWVDFDADGDLDVFVANQNGDKNGYFRNEGSRFVDAAADLKMDAPGRPDTQGSNGPSVADFDADGDFDLLVASYGPNFFYRNEGGGKFSEMAAAVGLGGGEKATPSRWGDFDNDGRPDVYVSSYTDRPIDERDYLYHNDGGRFTDVRAGFAFPRGATHGVQWVDYDSDGDLDLALANNNPTGAHPLYRNMLDTDRAKRSVEVAVLDRNGHATRAGSEVRVYRAGTRELLGTGLVDTGGGYCSQNVMAVHVGLPTNGRVDIEVTSLAKDGRQVTRVTGVTPGRGIVTVRTKH